MKLNLANFISLELCRSLNSIINQTVFLVGFPKIKTEDILIQSCPEANPSNLIELKNSIPKGINLMQTDGIVRYDENLIAITCMSVSGMSGSPLLIINNQRYEVV